MRFFATYRELAGLRESRVAVPAGAMVSDLLERVFEAHPKLADHRGSMLLAVNLEFAELDTRLRPDDEVALLPPVSGGAQMCWIQTDAIDPMSLIDQVRDDRAGAVVLFLGTVRADPGIGALDYEAYEPMAVKQMEAVRAAAKERFQVTEVSMVHRTGRLPLGETSVAIVCSAPHREAAFRACEWAMGELKRIVPVWKAEG